MSGHRDGGVPRRTMKRENNFWPMTIRAEDVIIDYDNKNIVFPNLQEDSAEDFSNSILIACYLKSEQFLHKSNMVRAGPKVMDAFRFDGCDPTRVLDDPTAFATITYIKNLCKSLILVGFDFHADGDTGLNIFHFDLDRLGELIAAGTESKGRRFGWAVYRRCSGKKGDLIPLRTGYKIT